ncbi:MAG: hypothetical protein EOO65_03615 [Methanosarcinales archaeon]|nr:MAG: hypothetical protein EOO65_03615 [Methanosarcinales archaeon]
METWVRSPGFRSYNPSTQSMLEGIIGWLKEWACSRSFGLGTHLPWDKQFVIESLSDSTIYMAYYTVAHLLQGGTVTPKDCATPGPAGIKPELLTDDVWDFIFLDGEFPADCGIPRETLDVLRREFNFWYPMDLRVSGKDLINNHLTMSLYNHAAIWMKAPRADRMPQSYFCNGHVLVDGEKMSKSKGNFIVLKEAMERWGSDATRFALADAGDSLEDANYEREKADNAILRLTTEEEYTKEMLAAIEAGKLRTGEKVFADLYVLLTSALAVAVCACAGRVTSILVIRACGYLALGFRMCAGCLSRALTRTSSWPTPAMTTCASVMRCSSPFTRCSWIAIATVTCAPRWTWYAAMHGCAPETRDEFTRLLCVPLPPFVLLCSPRTPTCCAASSRCNSSCWPPSARTFVSTCGRTCWAAPAW